MKERSRKRIASACLIEARPGPVVVSVQTNYKKKSAALEEAKAAVEELVLAGGHPAELLPRSPDILSAQVLRPILLLLEYSSSNFCSSVLEQNRRHCVLILRNRVSHSDVSGAHRCTWHVCESILCLRPQSSGCGDFTMTSHVQD